MTNMQLPQDIVNRRRAVAFIIDHILLSIIILVPFFVIFNINENFFSVFPFVTFAGFTVYTLKDVFGRSLGKRLFDLHIVSSESENKPKRSRLILRNLLIFIWPVEAIVMRQDDEGRRLGDKLARTKVVAYQRSKPLRPVLRGVLAFAVIYVIFFIAITFLLKTDPSYDIAIQYIKANESVASAVGEIEGYGFFSSGSISTRSASFKIPVYGSQDNILVEIDLTKKPGGEWVVNKMHY